MGKWLVVPTAMATILPTAWVCRNAAACRCRSSLSTLLLCASHDFLLTCWVSGLGQGVCYKVLTEAVTVPREMADGGCSSEGCSSGVGRLGAPVTMRKAFMSLLHQAVSSPALQHINASCLLPSRWSWSLSVPIPIHKSQNRSPSWVLESLI